MTQSINTGETWRFLARPDHAQRVYLVVEHETGNSRWMEMQPVAGQPGQWDLTTTLGPGRYRLRYFTAESGTFFNCGTAGLSSARLSDEDPAVAIETLLQAA